MYEEFLKTVPLFAELPDDDLSRLCRIITGIHLAAGEVLFEEGSPPDQTYIIHSGALEIIRVVDGREVLINVQEVPGTVIGEMALLADTPRLATVRALRDSFLLSMHYDWVHQLISLSPTAAKIVIRTAARRWGALENQVRHSKRMAQLGVMAAGLAHELNNPSAAVVRAAGQLQSAVESAQQAQGALERLALSEAQRAEISAARAMIRQTVDQPLAFDPLARSDREDAVEGWLDGRGVAESWRLAPTLVSLGLDGPALDRLASTFAGPALPVFLNWLESSHNALLLTREISQAGARVADIVAALKSYVFLDQAPLQEVDIHAGLENALIMLSQKLPEGITIRRDYDPDLPRITAYGSDLNQVWTSLIDNAIDAVKGRGVVTLRTRRRDGGVVVEVEDNGVGIAPADLPKVFDPFYTTKPPGQGSGLGLSMCYNIITGKHHGDIVATSVPGRTVFRVELPPAP